MKQLLWGLLISTGLISMLVNAEPYGLEREQARKRATQSSIEVVKLYTEVGERLKRQGITGEKEHDAYLLSLYKEGYEQWKKLRDTQCALKAQIEIYPDDSRLYEQTINYCVSQENKKYLQYLTNINNNISATHL